MLERNKDKRREVRFFDPYTGNVSTLEHTTNLKDNTTTVDVYIPSERPVFITVESEGYISFRPDPTEERSGDKDNPNVPDTGSRVITSLVAGMIALAAVCAVILTKKSKKSHSMPVH